MTTFRTVAPSEYQVEAFLTTELLSATVLNLIAAFEGDFTAVAAGVQLKRGALSTTLVTQAYTTPTGVGFAATVVLNPYSFCPSITLTNGSVRSEFGIGTGSTESPRVIVINQQSGASSGNVVWRYVNI